MEILELDGQTWPVWLFPRAQGRVGSQQIASVVFHSVYLNPIASGTEREGKLPVRASRC